MNAKTTHAAVLTTAVALSFSGATLAEQEGVINKDGNSTYTVPARTTQARELPDFENAKPMPLPRLKSLPAAPREGEAAPAPAVGAPGVEPGHAGNGKKSPVRIPAARELSPQQQDGGASAETGAAQRAFGSGHVPYTTMRVDLSGSNPSGWYPYSAAGKLYFKDGASTYVCSASLIKRGVIVTAAHCVAAFGQKRFYSNWVFVPALSGTSAPYGIWNAASASVKTSYYDGSDACAAKGVVCSNDVAVIRLQDKSGAYPGTATGWFGYAYNQWGFYNGTTLINQLGYPVSHDSGNKQQRTDSQGAVQANLSNNTVWGSQQTGGSSGGPELVNLGVPPVLSGTTTGTFPNPNVVVGVTSWGYTDPAVKLQGASSFTSNNIVSLVNTACGSPALPACK